MSASAPFACPVRQHARARPDAPAVVTRERTWTWAALDARVSLAAAHLAPLVPVGGPLGIVTVRAQPSPDLLAVMLAALRAGVLLAPLSPRLPTGALAAALDRLQSRVLVTDEPALALPGIRTVPLADFASGAAALFRPPPVLDLTRPAVAVFTSGSTGAPKPALLSVGNLVWSARGVNEAVGLGADDRWLLDLPLHHVGGLGVVIRCALAGASVVIPAPKTPTAEAVRHLGATHLSLVSTQLFRLLREEADVPPSLRAVLLGGSAFPAGLLDEARARGLPVATSYGLTEMASTVTMTAPGAPPADLRTSGRVLPHRELHIRDGEILVRGATRFLGYLSEPAPAKSQIPEGKAGGGLDAPFDADGWFATGDLGRLDAEGRLVVTGRRDSLFVSGGENVQPEEVEAALLALPGVARAVVVPVADPEFGQRPAAFVATETGAPPDAAALAAALGERLPRFKVPVRYLPWPADALDGKPDRKALARRAAGDQTDRGPQG